MSQLSVNTITNAAGGNTAQINGMTPTADSLQGFRNRLINSDMRIDQRNAGASVTINTAALNYTVDRWAAFGQATDGVFTVTRSSEVPSSAGFVNSLAATCTTADASISATNRYFLNQNIEGNNSADLQFGTAAAQAVTLSFWVRSSLTGTYCAAVLNGGGTRSYVAEYTISAADTWEYKTITIPGDTTGTWSTNETTGITLRFALAGGSTYQTTANAWAAGNFNTTTNQVNWMSSNSSRTFYITGVQLEKGSVATEFERRPYGTELALCQRYYYKKGPTGSDGFTQISFANITTTTNHRPFIELPVQMRTAPTSLDYFSVGFITVWGAGVVAASALAIDRANPNGVELTATNAALGTAGGMSIFLQNNNSGGYVALSAEL